MMRYATACFALLALSSQTHGQLTSPQVGWQADLETHFHDVAGLVTIVDEDTIRVDDFVFDGQGLDVVFYLGEENTTQAFTDGLAIGPQLVGTVYDGTQEPLLIDLPPGETLEGFNAISVWCVDVYISFGDATFLPAATPLEGDYTLNGSVDAADYTLWRDGLGAEYDEAQYAIWAENYGDTTATPTAVPEPTSVALLAGLSICFLGRRPLA